MSDLSVEAVEELIQMYLDPDGMVPVNFQPGYGRDAYNGGVSGIFFDTATRRQMLTPQQTRVLMQKFPKNFWIGNKAARVETVGQDAGGGTNGEALSVVDAGDLPGGVTREDLLVKSLNVLRKMAAQEAGEGEMVPRGTAAAGGKEMLVDFIMAKLAAKAVAASQ